MRALLTSKACFKSGVASGSTVTVCSELFDRTPFAPFPLCRPFAFSVFSLLSLLGVAGAVGGGRAGIHGFMYPWAMALHIWHNRTVSLFGRKMNTNSVELWDNKIWFGFITTPRWEKYAFTTRVQIIHLIPKFRQKRNNFKAEKTMRNGYQFCCCLLRLLSLVFSKFSAFRQIQLQVDELTKWGSWLEQIVE